MSNRSEGFSSTVSVLGHMTCSVSGFLALLISAWVETLPHHHLRCHLRQNRVSARLSRAPRVLELVAQWQQQLACGNVHVLPVFLGGGWGCREEADKGKALTLPDPLIDPRKAWVCKFSCSHLCSFRPLSLYYALPLGISCAFLWLRNVFKINLL